MKYLLKIITVPALLPKNFKKFYFKWGLYITPIVMLINFLSVPFMQNT